jgi:hypothetical protein
MRVICVVLALSAIAAAQPTVAPTPEAVGPAAGTTIGNYNIRQSFEMGLRQAGIDGNRGKYRSDVNFLNGVRVLGTSLTVNSRNGKGHYFDELILNTQGLGNDPYQFASLRAEKFRRYRYELTWRSNDYFNPGLTIAFGQHLQNLERRMQDHQFTLFPNGKLQFYGGFSRNAQDGPALSTANLFDARGNIFAFFENVRRQQNEYRIGGQADFAGFRLFWQRGWEYFKEDTRGTLDSAGVPLDPTVTSTTLASLRRDQPYHGATPHWRVNLFTERSRWFTINGRFTHSNGRRNFIHDELASGAIRGGVRNVQTLVFGDARRPVTSANLSFSILPTSTLTLSNHTAYHSTRMDGDNSIRQLTNGTLDSTLVNFQFLGIRAATNATILDWAARKWISFQGGYQFADRRVRSREQLDDAGFTVLARGDQSNRLHAGTAGFRLRPVKGLTIVADGEIGRQNRPFYNTSEKDYHAFGLRTEYKQKFFRVAAQFRSNVNFNSASLFRHSSRSRNFTVDATYTPNTRFAFDVGYQKLHIDTITGIAYFVSFEQVNGDRSFFLSNVHAAHVGARLALSKRFDFYSGLALTRDTASTRAEFSGFSPLVQAQVFPLNFVSPQARLSFKFRENVRWNLGYQHYHYVERLQSLQDYRAHTGFASVLWSF